MAGSGVHAARRGTSGEAQKGTMVDESGRLHENEPDYINCSTTTQTLYLVPLKLLPTCVTENVMA